MLGETLAITHPTPFLRCINRYWSGDSKSLSIGEKFCQDAREMFGYYSERRQAHLPVDLGVSIIAVRTLKSKVAMNMRTGNLRIRVWQRMFGNRVSRDDQLIVHSIAMGASALPCNEGEVGRRVIHFCETLQCSDDSLESLLLIDRALRFFDVEHVATSRSLSDFHFGKAGGSIWDHMIHLCSRYV